MRVVGLLGQCFVIGWGIWLALWVTGHAISRPGALYYRAMQGRSYHYAILVGVAAVSTGFILMLAGWLLS